ncbi:MAG TPA: bacillithiol biosynthesis cysteine-adding enzyme BshC, partial [Bacteroidia bacterium]|nr:bacillithiol biosynthesis cysteine-adding enzyme BshC [Bacteroidia bacterium]
WVKALKGQYGDLLNTPASETVRKNIDLLTEENTYTVTTGQQIHIYLGPLYVTYKIITAIAKCRWLAENFKGHNFVPVFWMATEDHDFDEISSINLYNRPFAWAKNEAYTGAVGRIHPASINELEKEIAPVIANDPEALKILELFTEAYKTYPIFSQATRHVVHTLFASEGLVIIDPDDAQLKKPFIPLIKEDIFKGKNFEIVNRTTEKFEEHFKAQISPREINFFYMTETGRHRLVFENNVYKALGTDLKWNEADLGSEIDRHPGKFSPNVVMRPVYQEVILPNLAYIGGAAEVTYWFQLRDVFKANGVQFPIIELRKSLIVLNEKTVDKISEMGFTPIDFLNMDNPVENTFLEESTADLPDLSGHYKIIAAELEFIKQKALEVDANLKPFLDGEFKKVPELLEKLDGKLEKAGKRRFEGQLKQVETIRNKFFKPGALAERTDNLLAYPALAGNEVIQKLVQTFSHENAPLILVLPPLK